MKIYEGVNWKRNDRSTRMSNSKAILKNPVEEKLCDDLIPIWQENPAWHANYLINEPIWLKGLLRIRRRKLAKNPSDCFTCNFWRILQNSCSSRWCQNWILQLAVMSLLNIISAPQQYFLLCFALSSSWQFNLFILLCDVGNLLLFSINTKWGWKLALLHF